MGKEVVFGLRPSDIYDSEYQAPDIFGQEVSCKVDVTELMGNEIFLYLLTGEKIFIARVDPRSKAQIGQDVKVVFDMERMQIFDRETEMVVR